MAPWSQGGSLGEGIFQSHPGKTPQTQAMQTPAHITPRPTNTQKHLQKRQQNK